MNIHEFKLRQPNHIILYTLISLATAVCFIFLFINFFDGRYFLFVLELSVCLVNLALLINFKKIIQSRFVDKFTIGYSCFILITVMMMLLVGGITNLTYVWIFLIPCVGYVVNGIRLGFWLTATFNLITLALYFINTHWEYETFNFTQFFNISFGLLVIWVIIHTNETIKNNMNSRLAKMAVSDSLTKLKNRAQLYKMYRQYPDTMMSLAMLNINCMRQVNDEHGYLAGDVVLINIANIILKNKQAEAEAFRIGDAEYAILIPNVDAEEALTHIRELFAKMVNYDIVLKNTVIDPKISIALTSIKSDGNNLDDLLQKTNNLLEKAKHSTTDKIAVSV